MHSWPLMVCLCLWCIWAAWFHLTGGSASLGWGLGGWGRESRHACVGMWKFVWENVCGLGHSQIRSEVWDSGAEAQWSVCAWGGERSRTGTPVWGGGGGDSQEAASPTFSCHYTLWVQVCCGWIRGFFIKTVTVSLPSQTGSSQQWRHQENLSVLHWWQTPAGRKMASGIRTLRSKLPTQIGHLTPDCCCPVWQYFSFSFFIRVSDYECMPGFSTCTTPPIVHVSLRVGPHPLSVAVVCRVFWFLWWVVGPGARNVHSWACGDCCKDTSEPRVPGCPACNCPWSSGLNISCPRDPSVVLCYFAMIFAINMLRFNGFTTENWKH